MGRLLAIDYGRKRVGIAVTDPLKMIASSLTTVHASEIWNFLNDYLQNEQVDGFVVGYPRNMDGSKSEATVYIEPFVRQLKKKYQHIPVEYFDERFTSKMAFQAMIDGGLKKKARRDKGLVDKISASIILQDYLKHNKGE